MRYYEDEMILDEGPLCLDFANTLAWHASQNPIENLVDYPTLVKWAVDKKILLPEEGEELLAAAQNDTQAASEALQEAIKLREALYRVFTAAIDKRDAEPADLEIIGTWSARLLPRRKLYTENGDLKWHWTPPHSNLDAMLAPVIVSALNLVTAPELHRVGQCADDRGCGWLFLDLSRNRSRQWCSMEGCGNRAKAKRHYQRARQTA